MNKNDRITRLLPLLTAVATYGVCYLIGKYAAGLTYHPMAIGRDIFLQVIFAYLIMPFFRRRWIFVAVQVLLMTLLFLGNAGKIAFHGVPVNPDDIFSVYDLFWVAKPWQRIAMLAYGSCLGLLILLGTHWRRMAGAAAGMLLIIVLMTPARAAVTFDFLKEVFGHSSWDTRGNLVERGVSLHTIMDVIRYASYTHEPPSADEVNQAMAGVGDFWPPFTDRFNEVTPASRLRNVHMILLESFWDASQLSAAKFSRHPMEDTFLELWKAGGASKGMAPVYGGYTANSEFEVLTGFPVMENGVRFERQLRNNVPALPRLLAERGYTTLASHPNVAGFWNRTNAYRRLGFQTYWSVNDFAKDDMNDFCLSDQSLYRQVLKKIGPLLASGKPVFNYMVTYTGHVPYPLNDKRPPIIRSQSKYPLVEAYANMVYYKSKELSECIAAIRERDPDALIVAFGDHAPFLAPNHAAYEESNLLVEKMPDWNGAMLKTAYSTPLLIINGRKGPLNVGYLPLFRLPSLITSLLGIKDKGMLDYTAGPHGFKIRPLPGRRLVLDRADHPLVFNDGETTPQQLNQWVKQMTTLSNDLFIGRQYCLNTDPKELILDPMLTRHSDEEIQKWPNL